MVFVKYYTDPACPWSWAAEPMVRKLMVQFGERLRWTFVMGGLARDWSAAAGGAGGEQEVRARLVREWLEVADRTGAPLDPLLWIDSPIDTSYPACIAVKAAAEQADDAGCRYLRVLREGLMCERRKLDRAEALVEEGRAAGLDVERFRIDLRSHAATEAFAADLEDTNALAARERVEAASGGGSARFSRGAGGAPLPSMVFREESGREHEVIGLRPYDAYRDAAVAAGTGSPDEIVPDVEELVARFGRVTTSEVEVICELPGPRAGAQLFKLAEQWRLRPLRRLTGYLWEAP
jgi:protein-disulfide isomerase-like protein with CxxC motif